MAEQHAAPVMPMLMLLLPATAASPQVRQKASHKLKSCAWNNPGVIEKRHNSRKVMSCERKETNYVIDNDESDWGTVRGEDGGSVCR